MDHSHVCDREIVKVMLTYLHDYRISLTRNEVCNHMRIKVKYEIDELQKT